MDDSIGTITNLTSAQAHEIMHALEVCVLSHDQWFWGLVSNILRKTLFEIIYTEEDSYKICGTGRWLASVEPLLGKLLIYKDIVLIHKRVHQLSSEISNIPLSAYQNIYALYDELIVIRDAFRFHVGILDSEIKQIIFQTDPLTGLLNRSKMNHVFGRKIKDGCEKSVICIVDIDYFKKVNDTYGHNVGDMVLVHFSKLLRSRLRCTDMVFRYGGEEFLIFLTDISKDKSKEFIIDIFDKIRLVVEGSTIILPDSRTIAVTASFGVSKFLSYISIEDNINKADKALYLSKKNGRNLVTFC